MAVKTLSIQEAIQQVGLKVLIYGRPGVGKTTLARTVPKPALVIDFEGGILALMNEPDIVISPVESTNELLSVVAELRSDTLFKTVIFDGLSLFVRRRVQELRASKEFTTWSDWQQLTNELRAAILPLLHLRKHLLLTALSRTITVREDKQTKVIGVQPDLTPALLRDLTAACDLVGLLIYNDELFPEIKDRTVLFAPVNSLHIVCKSRLPNLKTSEPNFSKWLEIAQVPELVPQPSKVNISIPIVQEQTKQEQPKETLQEANDDKSISDALTRQIFDKAKALGLDNKALGRIARQYFSQSYIRDLSVEQKQRLLEILDRQLQQRGISVEASREAPQVAQEDPQADLQDDSILEFLISWRRSRNYDQPIPFEAEFVEIAVKKGWLPDELEAAITEILLEKNFDFNSISDTGYWLAQIPEDLLSEVCAELKNR